MRTFTCDMCGKELEHHGQRYLMTVQEVVPRQYMEPEPMKFDLCHECVVKLNEQLDRGGK